MRKAGVLLQLFPPGSDWAYCCLLVLTEQLVSEGGVEATISLLHLASFFPIKVCI
jgi:hypothetical protein